MNIFSSFGNQYIKEMPYVNKQFGYWHPGYAWACTRKAYDRMGGLYEPAILGSADNVMALSLIGKGLKAINENSTDDYKQSVLEFQNRVRHLRSGYVPGVIRHYFHGSKKNRKYNDRWQILLKHEYSPMKHITADKSGILVPTDSCPQEMLDEIMYYFRERNEDEFYQRGASTNSFHKLVEKESTQTLVNLQDEVMDDYEENDILDVDDDDHEIADAPTWKQLLFSAIHKFLFP